VSITIGPVHGQCTERGKPNRTANLKVFTFPNLKVSALSFCKSAGIAQVGRVMVDVFAQIDEDRSGTITQSEFQLLKENEDAKEALGLLGEKIEGAREALGLLGEEKINKVKTHEVPWGFWVRRKSIW
jgi:hypothetical protein